MKGQRAIASEGLVLFCTALDIHVVPTGCPIRDFPCSLVALSLRYGHLSLPLHSHGLRHGPHWQHGPRWQHWTPTTGYSSPPLSLPPDQHILTHHGDSCSRLAMQLVGPWMTSCLCTAGKYIQPTCVIHQRAGLWVACWSIGLCLPSSSQVCCLDLI